MIIDTRTEFAENLALAAGAWGDVIDLSKTGIDQGAGKPPIILYIKAGDTAVSGATFSLVTSDSDDLSGATVLISTGSATVEKGETIYDGPIPASAEYKRYLGISVGGGSGNASAFLLSDAHQHRAYPAAA